MKDIKRKELELLDKICKQNGVPLKLAQDLIKTAGKMSYKNLTQGARINEYEEWIKIHLK